MTHYLNTYEVPAPVNFEVKNNKYGKGMFATRDIAKGDVVYTGRCLLIPNIPGKILVLCGDERVELDVLVHSVARHNTQLRELYFFDAYMNHSCEPNTYSRDGEVGADFETYDTVASRDIKAGDEINCDYCLFEWDCRDKGIDQCGCGSELCRGQVWGFKFVPEPHRSRMLPHAHQPVLAQLRAEALLEAKQVIYEVNIEIAPDLAQAFAAWLKHHVDEMLEIKGFQRCIMSERDASDEASESKNTFFTCQYFLDSRISLDNYFRDHAPRMRADGLLRFPSLKATRRSCVYWVYL